MPAKNFGTSSARSVRPGVRPHRGTESVKRRDRIANVVGRLDIAAIVVVGTPMTSTKQERARRCCLERPLYELDALGVREVWLDSRREVQDGRDLALLDSARDKGIVSREMVIGFARSGALRPESAKAGARRSGGEPSFTSLQAAPGELVQALHRRGRLSAGSVICPEVPQKLP
ncbi:hypothetical protein ACQPXM_35745 [Kribbella sp. CA-253562]|uniref:hypothetical protein n=1 Tax=Kribbella sp. CA-253562 TaxID=3239942 RepID=UPI003D8F09E0